jgi:3-oxoacyl-[acyl-carrier-protein] synthase II
VSGRQVVITGIGLVTPLGASFADFSSALYEPGGRFEVVVSRHAAALPGARVHMALDAELDRGEQLLSDRSTRLALLASSRALHDAGWAAGASALHDCGVFVGCASGPTESVNASYTTLHDKARLPALTLLRCMPSAAAASIAIRHGLRGPNQTYASACASSALAIGEALRAIRHGYLDVALAGGTEAPFGDGTLKAWEALRMLAPLGQRGRAGVVVRRRLADAACRPFDRQRSGIVLGEGAVFFVLEAAEHAAARGAPAMARLAGFAATGDGHHWTEPCSAGQVRAMKAALADARLSAHDIGYVNAYGPGTPIGDRVEAGSIATVFGAGPTAPWVSSTKATHGHLLGASGAIELAASVATLASGQVPPTRNLREPDAACAANLVRKESVPLPAGKAVLSNSFAFGGSNACLVVAAA